ncbi:glycoside hydrolase [Jaminaea rosea]|uniref:Beta-mannosidase A n=1 Tax=Jaminaea rosea TaxID=1569628 RepID=A0A316UJB7_9BASI|nr:glycoside hydrolase [Jaminaea rosea]PWN25387.1 glycoside hydrolase [Jaminaea rosea]
MTAAFALLVLVALMAMASALPKVLPKSGSSPHAYDSLYHPVEGPKVYPLSSTESHAWPLPLAWTQSTQSLAHASLGDDTLSPAAGLNWHLTNFNGSIEIPALFPSQAHLDLIQAGTIREPSIELDEGPARWIINDTWTWTASLLPLAKAISAHKELLLFFRGLDTVCKIFVGGEPLAVTDNEFREYLFLNATPLLKDAASIGSNLTLIFQSAANYSKQASIDHPHTPWPDGLAQTYQYPYRQDIRKGQSDFGWDWGPAYLPTGPVRPAYIVGLDDENDANRTSVDGNSTSLFVARSSLDVYREGSFNNLPPNQHASWIVNATMDIYALHDLPGAQLDITVLGTKHAATNVTLSRPLRAGLNEGVWATMKVPATGPNAPDLWWPARHGKPTLYDVEMGLTAPRLRDTRTSWRKRTGFRTIVVNQEPVTTAEVARGWAPGSHWQVEVNGKPVYTHGANLIPLDTFAPRVSLDSIDWLTSSVLATGGNLIRIWGGGIYQPDALYDLCDEKGIMLWSETIFADSMYPINPPFLESVRHEVRENVLRLNHHPSQMLWAGNNEGEPVLFLVADGPKVSKENRTRFYREYELLFDEVILGEVKGHSRKDSYIPSSTTYGYKKLDPYVPRYKDFPKNEVHGNGEYYGYSAPQFFNTSAYTFSSPFRMVNEYGMHAMASTHGLERVLAPATSAPQQWSFNSTQIVSHNKHSPPGNLTFPFFPEDGQGQMSDAVKLYLPTPAARANGTLQIRQWSYATQLIQLIYVAQAQTLEYRHRGIGPQRNSGAVYWQLNDVWPGSTSWSSIELGGRWKPLHYGMAKAQAPLVVYANWNATIVGEEPTLSLVALWDRETAPNGGKVRATWYDWEGKAVGASREYEIDIDQKDSEANEQDTVGGQVITSPAPLAKYVSPGVDTTAVWLHLEVKADSISTAAGAQQESYSWEDFWTPPGNLASPATLKALQELGQGKVELRELRRGSEKEPDDDRRVSEGRKSVTRRFEVVNTGTKVAPYVWLDHPEGTLGWFEEEHSGAKSVAHGSIRRSRQQRQSVLLREEDQTSRVIHTRAGSRDHGSSPKAKPNNLFWLRPGERRVVRFVQRYGGQKEEGHFDVWSLAELLRKT